MAEILGLGLSHYPPLSTPDAMMSGILRTTLKDPGIPDAAKDPAHWPAAMQAEWGQDQGTLAAAQHRAAMVAQFRRMREELDRFNAWWSQQIQRRVNGLRPAEPELLVDLLNVVVDGLIVTAFDAGQPWAQGRRARLLKAVWRALGQ